MVGFRHQWDQSRLSTSPIGVGNGATVDPSPSVVGSTVVRGPDGHRLPFHRRTSFLKRGDFYVNSDSSNRDPKKKLLFQTPCPSVTSHTRRSPLLSQLGRGHPVQVRESPSNPESLWSGPRYLGRVNILCYRGSRRVINRSTRRI